MPAMSSGERRRKTKEGEKEKEEEAARKRESRWPQMRRGGLQVSSNWKETEGEGDRRARARSVPHPTADKGYPLRQHLP
mgnify:CR=1 FL=1